MNRWRIAALPCASIYGFAIGSVHSTAFALRNLVKMPLLLLVTALVCSLAYYVISRTFTRSLRFREVQREAFAIFGDTAVLLGSLALPMYFLAHAIVRPDERGLNEYETFLVANVVVIAVAGSFALARRALALAAATDLGRATTGLLVASWIAVSLLVGAQWSWYLRPFCGVATVDAPFVLGTEPDFRGDRSFYEAFAHAIRRGGR